MPRAAAAVVALSLLAPVAPGTGAGASGPTPRPRASVEALVANANRVPAGRLARGVLTVSLVARAGRWFPEEGMGAGLDVEAFAEEGGPLRDPGPLIRVPAGTEIRASIRNDLAGETLVVHGLVSHPAGRDDTLQVAPGATRTTSFAAGEPGTYLYWASTQGAHSIAERRGRDSQLSGAFVVDPPGVQTADRIFVITLFDDTLEVAGSRRRREVMGLNGLSYPATERLDYAVGDSVHWRLVNASDRMHPMHLHGFYFRVDARGDAARDTVYAPDQRQLAVTERMAAGGTARVAWSPDRPGSWVFHCHILYHITPALHLALSAADTMPAGAHMAGLLLAMRVRDAAGGARAALPADTQRVRLLVQSRPRVYGDDPGLGFVVQGDGPVSADSISIPGVPIVLTRGRLARITVVNRLAEPTSVHWHGLELESFFDGVAGMSGSPGRLAPLVAPGDSFTAEMTPPRAGTFIYHTHLDDVRQMSLGLYGPLLVLAPGERYDPRTDHVVFVSLGGLGDSVRVLINGRRDPAPLSLRAGVPQRLRFVLMAAFGQGTFRLLRDTTPERWQPLAKDGADLPLSRRAERPAAVTLAVGEAYDFAYTPVAGAALRLELRTVDGRRLLATLPVHIE